jgi:hypothetical protein
MKKYVIAVAIASGALFGLSAQAAPLSTETAAVQSQVAQESATSKVYYYHGRHRSHWRHGSGGGGHWRWGSGRRWGGDWGHNRHRSHWRWGSRW